MLSHVRARVTRGCAGAGARKDIYIYNLSHLFIIIGFPNITSMT